MQYQYRLKFFCSSYASDICEQSHSPATTYLFIHLHSMHFPCKQHVHPAPARAVLGAPRSTKGAHGRSKQCSQTLQFSLMPKGTVTSAHTFHIPVSSFSDGHGPYHSAVSSPLLPPACLHCPPCHSTITACVCSWCRQC
jgi:hypothetical protein